MSASDVTSGQPSSAMETVVRNGPATLRDVAEAAGVSVSTVSLVINRKPNARIGDAARQRVLEAVDRLGYRPNALAKSLVRGRSKFIGIVADAIATTPFAGAIIRGAQEEAWKHGYVLLIADTDDVPEATADAVQMMHDHQAMGILYSTWYHRAVEPPESLKDVPAVFVNCFAENDDRPAVVPDERQGGRTATSLLLAQGHRNIVFINSEEDAASTVGRFEGFKEALGAAGVAFDASMLHLFHPGDDLDFAESGYRAGREILSRPQRPTAVFCYNDRTAMGVYEAARELGLSIPDDLSVVGFDDQEVIAAHLRPRLTTVALPHYELGVAGVRTLLDLIGDETSHAGIQRIACPPVVRASVEPVAAP